LEEDICDLYEGSILAFPHRVEESHKNLRVACTPADVQTGYP